MPLVLRGHLRVDVLEHVVAERRVDGVEERLDLRGATRNKKSPQGKGDGEGPMSRSGGRRGAAGAEGSAREGGGGGGGHGGRDRQRRKLRETMESARGRTCSNDCALRKSPSLMSSCEKCDGAITSPPLGSLP